MSRSLSALARRNMPYKKKQRAVLTQSSFLDFRTIGRKGEKVKMMDEKEIMPYNFFKYGGVYTGEHHGMRYLIKNTGEKPDFKLMVQVWLGPYASTAVPDEKKTTQYFESSVEGRKEAINWLHEQYETRRGEWDTAPALLDAVLPQ